MNLLSQTFGLALSGLGAYLLIKGVGTHTTADLVLDGAMIFVGGYLLTGDKMNAAVDELARYLPWMRRKDDEGR